MGAIIRDPRYGYNLPYLPVSISVLIAPANHFVSTSRCIGLSLCAPVRIALYWGQVAAISIVSHADGFSSPSVPFCRCAAVSAIHPLRAHSCTASSQLPKPPYASRCRFGLRLGYRAAQAGVAIARLISQRCSIRRLALFTFRTGRSRSSGVNVASAYGCRWYRHLNPPLPHASSLL